MKRLHHDQLQRLSGGDYSQWMAAGNACGVGLPGSVALFPNPVYTPFLGWMLAGRFSASIGGCLETTF